MVTYSIQRVSVGLRSKAAGNRSCPFFRLANVQTVSTKDRVERDRGRNRRWLRLDLAMQLELGTNNFATIAEIVGVGEHHWHGGSICIQPVRGMAQSTLRHLSLSLFARSWFDFDCSHHGRTLSTWFCHALLRYGTMDTIPDRSRNRGLCVGWYIASHAHASRGIARRSSLVLDDFRASLAYQKSLGVYRSPLHNQFCTWHLCHYVQRMEAGITVKSPKRNLAYFNIPVYLFAQPNKGSCQNLQAIPVAELAKSFGTSQL